METVKSLTKKKQNIQNKDLVLLCSNNTLKNNPQKRS